MRLVIAGDRRYDDYVQLCEYADDINSVYVVDEVVSGGARGADTLGERWAASRGIPVTRFPAEWEVYGSGAGHIRNGQMASFGDMLLAFLTIESKGTRNMIEQMRSMNKPCRVVWAVIP